MARCLVALAGAFFMRTEDIMKTQRERQLFERQRDREAKLFGPLWGATYRFDDAVVGSENAQVATGQGENDQLATGQQQAGETTPLATETSGENQNQDAAGQQTEEKGPVPYERFAEVNREAKEAKERTQQLEQYLYSMQMRQQQQQQPQQQQDPFEQFVQQNGIGQDGWVTPDDLKKVNTFFRQQQTQLLESQQQQQWMDAHPDYTGIVVTPAGTPSEHLMNAFKADPVLHARMRQNWDPVVAYHIAKQFAQGQRTPSSGVSAIDQIKAGQRAPQGISAASGGGGQVDQASAIQGMSDEQFREYWQKKKTGS